MDILLQLSGCSMMVISMGFLATFWFRAMFAFDKLIEHEYENLPEQWEKDGQPRGMFWKPQHKQITLFNRIFRGNVGFAALRFIFTTPKWVIENPEPAAYLKRLRKFTLLWSIGVITWFFVIFPAILVVFTPQ